MGGINDGLSYILTIASTASARTSIMKMTRYVLMVALTLTVLSGCGKSKKPDEESGPRIVGGGKFDSNARPAERNLGGSGNNPAGEPK